MGWVELEASHLDQRHYCPFTLIIQTSRTIFCLYHDVKTQMRRMKRAKLLLGVGIIENNNAELEKHTFNISHSRLETFSEIWILFLTLFVACFIILAKSINLSIPQVDLSKLRIIYPYLLGSQACEVERVNGRKFRKYPKHCLSESP